ncbi:MAG: hypothetical protein QM775_28190 [Pirellulales bacterium]
MTGAEPRKPAKPEDARNPFARKAASEATPTELDDLLAVAQSLGVLDAPAPETEQEPKTINGDDWQQMPLVLSSTMVGLRTRKAVINGRAFAEGTAIGELGAMEIRLQTVTPRRAVVVWNGTVRELRIPKPGEEPPPAAPTASGTDQRQDGNSELEGLGLPAGPGL